MSTPQGTPVKQSRLGLASTKSSPLTNEFKRLLCDQHQRLSLKHQQDLDLIDDIRSYVKARLSIERDYTNALQKLAKHHSNHIQKKFQLLHQLDRELEQNNGDNGSNSNNQGPDSGARSNNTNGLNETTAQHQANQTSAGPTRTKHQHNSPTEQEPTKPSSLYRVWSDHVKCLLSTAKNRADQFDQSNLIVDKLKDIRQHKASIGKKCLDTHLRRIQEDLIGSVLDVDKAKKLYYEDESQAKKARENEERIKKKRSGLLTKFTDLQAKKEKSSAQREATDIQSTQARNDYIMALAAANAHLNYYYYRDLKDFIHLIDDGVLDHCKIFMATLSECDIDSLKDSLSHAQYWSKLINLTGSQQTNQIFLDCGQSKCLREKQELQFEACNNDTISKISLEHNADYALQHEIDKWFTWFKKECRNLSQLMHQLDTCKQAFADGKKSIELNGQTIDDLEPKIIDLKQQIRKCESAKLRAQARLMVIKEGGMQIEEWSAVELEIRADMARAQEEQERAKRSREFQEESPDGRTTGVSFDEPGVSAATGGSGTEQGGGRANLAASSSIQLQVSRDSDDIDTQAGESMHNLASVSRSTSNLVQKQQQALSGYSALTDPSLVWQDDYSNAWAGGGTTGPSQEVAFRESEQTHEQPMTTIKSPTSPHVTDGFGGDGFEDEATAASGYDHLAASAKHNESHLGDQNKQQHIPNASMSIQSSSPLSAIVNGGQHLSQSPYQGVMSEAYKSDYECDYTRIGQHFVRSAASSVEPNNQQQQLTSRNEQDEEFGVDVGEMLNSQVIALYKFEKNNHDDLEFDEHDLLEVIEVNANDTNWVKARHLTNGCEGYIPSSYVRLYINQNDHDEGDARRQANSWSIKDRDDQHRAESDQGADSAGGGGESRQTKSLDDGGDDEDGGDDDEGGQDSNYCRALYDYSPDGEAVDEVDGLPHLALRQGELCRIIDQGEDDGWWLVEKQETGDRGHVPSMLVEEVELGDEDEILADEGDVTDDEILDDDGNAYEKPPPSFDAPTLELAEDPQETEQLETGDVSEQGAEQSIEPMANGQSEPTVDSADQMTTAEKQNASLMPKSFIIIEPTPDVESKRFEDDLGRFEDRNDEEAIRETAEIDEHDYNNNRQASRQVVQSQPPSSSSTSSPGQAGYSVYNDEFVLERPNRRANASAPETHQAHHQRHHHVSPPHEPTIIEEDDGGGSQSESTLKREPPPPRRASGDIEPDSYDVDEFGFDRNRPPPPSVVIDSVEAIPRSPDLSFDDDQNEQHSETQSQSGSGQSVDSPSGEVKSIKQSGFQDVNPILRHHADEFTRQLIEEALMLAPGSQIGPSTSSSDMQNDSEQDEEMEDENESHYALSNHLGPSADGNNEQDDY